MALRGLAMAFALGIGALQGAPTYSTHGVVKSFGPERAYVVIAHDAIPGYMMAMAMSFEPRSAMQLAGIAAGDKVALRFTDSDGHRHIDTIVKE